MVVFAKFNKQGYLKILLVMAVLLNTAKFSEAQSFEYQPGYIINQERDSLVGYIYDDGIKGTSREINFRSTIGGNVEHVNASKVVEVYFGVNNHLISYHDSIDHQYYFLRELERGAITLFAYFHNEEYTFIVEKGREHTVLFQYSVNVNNGEKTKSSRYKGVLKLWMGDCQKVSKKIQKTPFEIYDLQKLVSEYNKCIDPEYVSSMKKPLFQYGINLGVNFNTSTIRFVTIFKDIRQEGKFGLLFGGFVGLNFSKKLFASASLNYSEYLSSLTNYKDPSSVITRNVDFSFKYIDFPLRLQYLVLDTRPVDVSIFGSYGIGFLVSQMIKSKSDFSIANGDVPFDLDKLKYGVGAGIDVSYKKVSALVGYYQSSGKDGPSAVIEFRGFNITASYKF